jgi:uncharacterized protein YdeI (YjbR/CyaY-like superfamily)
VAKADHLDRLELKSSSRLRAWLEENHDGSPGAWLVITKKASRNPGIAYEEAVEEALSFGWIDGRASTLDDEKYLLLLTPRKPGSIWAKSNKERVERLLERGLMTEAGLAKVEAARKDGSWSRMDEIEALRIPPDLRAALDAEADAKKNFNAFSDSSKKMILAWILGAKRPETRSKRINETVSAAAQNRKPR